MCTAGVEGSVGGKLGPVSAEFSLSYEHETSNEVSSGHSHEAAVELHSDVVGFAVDYQHPALAKSRSLA